MPARPEPYYSLPVSSDVEKYGLPARPFMIDEDRQTADRPNTYFDSARAYSSPLPDVYTSLTTRRYEYTSMSASHARPTVSLGPLVNDACYGQPRDVEPDSSPASRDSYVDVGTDAVPSLIDSYHAACPLNAGITHRLLPAVDLFGAAAGHPSPSVTAAKRQPMSIVGIRGAAAMTSPVGAREGQPPTTTVTAEVHLRRSDDSERRHWVVNYVDARLRPTPS